MASLPILSRRICSRVDPAGLGDLFGKWVLLPRAEIARKALPEAIFRSELAFRMKSQFTRRCRYNPVWKDWRRCARVDIVTLTSPSTVHNFTAVRASMGWIRSRCRGIRCLPASARLPSKPPAKKVL